jgi:hypothetical protein
MPPKAQVLVIADYLESLGQSSTECNIEREIGSANQFYRVWLYQDTEVSLYFTQKTEDKSVFKATFYCDYLAQYLRDFVRDCENGGKVQGRILWNSF